jgi:hypothetical protein
MTEKCKLHRFPAVQNIWLSLSSIPIEPVGTGVSKREPEPTFYYAKRIKKRTGIRIPFKRKTR